MTGTEQKKILIVEDSWATAGELKSRLEKMGYQIAGVLKTGEDAVAFAMERKPDLIIMDIVLNGAMDGISAAEEIRKCCNVPFVFITSHTDNAILERAKLTDPDGYLLQPFTNEDLHVAVEIALQRHMYEKSLDEKERKYRVLFEESIDSIFFLDQDNRLIEVNRAMEYLFLYRRSDLLQMSLKDLFAGQVDYVFFEKELYTGGYVKNLEVNLVRSDGERIVCLVSANVIRDSSGAVSGYQGIIRDITEKRLIELERLESITKLREGMNGIIQAISMTVEARDPYTAGHQRRVSRLGRIIAEEMSLSHDTIDGIRLAGLIHDLGKISVPTEILSKPGRITTMEFDLIKIHSQVGYDILKKIHFPWPIADIVHQHHERIDGSGYPEGMKFDDMLIEAKIIGVADVVEAMASHRPYRAALGLELALNEIRENKGIRYDEDVVDACTTAISENRNEIEYELDNGTVT